MRGYLNEYLLCDLHLLSPNVRDHAASIPPGRDCQECITSLTSGPLDDLEALIVNRTGRNRGSDILEGC